MRCAFAVAAAGRVWRVALALLMFLCVAWPAQAQPAIVLDDTMGSIDAAPLAQRWIDASGEARVEQVAGGKLAHFTPNHTEQVDALGERAALWLRLRVERKPASSQADWLLEFPLPLLDSVTVHFLGADGKWVAQTAGDTVAVSMWPEPGRHAFFRVSLGPGQMRDLYVRVRHFTPVSVPIRLTSAVAHHERLQLDYLWLGVVFGAFVILIAASSLQAWLYRDRTYTLYVLYSVLVLLAVAAYTGVAAQFLWNGNGPWSDTAQGVLGVLAVGAALAFVRNITGIAVRYRLLGLALRGVAWLSPLLAIVYMLVPRSSGLLILSVLFVAAVVLCLLSASLTWWRGDEIGLWVLAAYALPAVTLLVIQARVMGWTAANWFNQHGIVVSMALQVPLLLVALNMRSRDRHAAQIREQAIVSQDPLTGLLSEHLFHDRLRQTIGRYRRHGDDAAVIFIELVNYKRIRASYGTAVAEQSLLRSVIKLRGLLRDVDTAARVGESRFGIIMEGVSSRAVVTDRGARLIASGLMPLKGLKPDVTLQFHVAGALLCDRIMEAHELTREMDTILEGMSPRTRRPIRFVEAEVTMPSPLEADSMVSDDDAGSAPSTDPQGARDTRP